MSALVCLAVVTDQIIDSMTTSVVYVYALVDDLTPSLGRWSHGLQMDNCEYGASNVYLFELKTYFRRLKWPR